MKRITLMLGYGLLGLLPLLSLSALADNNPDYYEQHAKGWHWYEDPAPDQAQQNNKADPVTQMSAVKQALQHALDQAILNPTPQHVKDYIVLQNQMSDRASRFSKVWQAVLLLDLLVFN